MKVAVVTPYYKEAPEILAQGHASVLAQTHPCRHILVADGHPQPALSDWQADHISLPCAHGDIGSTPRLIGCVHAIGLGYDAIAFLDADNWYRADHIARLVSLARASRADFVSSNRVITRLDGSVMGDCGETDPELFVDTNCMMFLRPAFAVLMTWVLMPDFAHLIGDRVVYQKLRLAGHRTAHDDARTVFYRAGRQGTYRTFGETPPPEAVPSPDFRRAMRRWANLGNPDVRKPLGGHQP